MITDIDLLEPGSLVYERRPPSWLTKLRRMFQRVTLKWCPCPRCVHGRKPKTLLQYAIDSGVVNDVPLLKTLMARNELLDDMVFVEHPPDLLRGHYPSIATQWTRQFAVGDRG